jgi:hypothetical protein
MLPVIPFALTAPVGGLIGARITAIVAAAVAIYLNAVGRKRDDRSRRRNLYSEAYKLALEWCEGIYRVRRRAPDGSQDQELVKHFHDLQERIAYYQGWLSIESAPLGQSYQHFLETVLTECQPLIREAWSTPGRGAQLTPEGETAPDLDEAKSPFLGEVRRHLSPWWETA